MRFYQPEYVNQAIICIDIHVSPLKSTLTGTTKSTVTIAQVDIFQMVETPKRSELCVTSGSPNIERPCELGGLRLW